MEEKYSRLLYSILMPDFPRLWVKGTSTPASIESAPQEDHCSLQFPFVRPFPIFQPPNIPNCPSPSSFIDSESLASLFLTLLIRVSTPHDFILSASKGRKRSTGGRLGSPGSSHLCQSLCATISGIRSWPVFSATSSFGSTVIMANVSMLLLRSGERQRRHTPPRAKG